MAIATDRGSNLAREVDAKPEWEDFVHVGPGTLAGRYLRMFWHPVCRAEDIKPGWTKPIRLMGEDFTLYRGESGKPHLVAFRCAHRGTQLTAGWVEGDDLRCYYHGWKYDATGQCIEQPGEREPFCQRIRIASWPAEEYIGLIFVYIGEGEPPPLPRYPEVEHAPGLLEPWLEEAPCNYFNRLDNAADSVHVPFVHSNRNGKGIKVPLNMRAQETEYGFVCQDYPESGKRGAAHSRFHMPNMNYMRLGAKNKALETGPRVAVMWRVPLDDDNHIAIGTQRVQVFGENVEKYVEQWRAAELEQQRVPMAETARAVLAGRMKTDEIAPGRWWDSSSVQDMVTMIGQDVIAHRDEEHLGRSDVGVIFIRQLYQRELRALAEGRPLKQWAAVDAIEEDNEGGR